MQWDARFANLPARGLRGIEETGLTPWVDYAQQGFIAGSGLKTQVSWQAQEMDRES